MTDYWSYILCESFYSTYFGEKYGFSNDTPLSILSSWLHFFFFKKPSTSLRAQSFLAQPGFEGSEFLSSLMNKLIFFSRNRPPVWGLKVSKLNLDLRAQNFLIASWFATEEKSMPYIKIIFYTISLLEWLICFHDKKKLNLHVSSFLGPQHLSPQFLSGSEIWYPVSYKWASYKEKKDSINSLWPSNVNLRHGQNQHWFNQFFVPYQHHSISWNNTNFSIKTHFLNQLHIKVLPFFKCVRSTGFFS